MLQTFLKGLADEALPASIGSPYTGAGNGDIFFYLWRLRLVILPNWNLAYVNAHDKLCKYNAHDKVCNYSGYVFKVMFVSLQSSVWYRLI